MTSSFADYVVQDLLSSFKNVRARKMFGGYGVFVGNTMFGIIVDDELYYKVGDSNRSEFEKMGSRPFEYGTRRGKRVSMSYWKLPSEVMDDLQILEEWTEKAMRVAVKGSKTPSKASARKSTTSHPIKIKKTYQK